MVDYVTMELEGRQKELEEGILAENAKVRQARVSLEAVEKRAVEMIKQYQAKLESIEKALSVLRGADC